MMEVWRRMAVRLCKSQIRGLITHNAIAETPLVPKGRQPLGRGVNPCAMDTWRVVASERRHNFYSNLTFFRQGIPLCIS